jgi:hypothetical protein
MRLIARSLALALLAAGVVVCCAVVAQNQKQVARAGARQASKIFRTSPSGSFTMRQRLSNTIVGQRLESAGVQVRPGWLGPSHDAFGTGCGIAATVEAGWHFGMKSRTLVPLEKGAFSL